MRRPTTMLCVWMLLAACGDDGGGPGGSGETDAGPLTADSGPPTTDAGSECTGADGLPCLTLATGTPANFTCTPSMPVPGAIQPLTLNVSNDVTFRPAPAGLVVEVFPDDVVHDTCTGSCISVTTDAMGLAVVDLPATSWFAFRIPSTGTNPDDVLLSTGYRIIRATDTRKRVSYLTHGDAQRIASAVGREIVPGSAALQGGVYDCDEQTVAGATVRIFVDGEELATGTGPTDAGIGYFDGMTAGTTTSGSGGYFAANIRVPEGGALARVQVYGTRTPGGERELIACEEARIFPDSYNTRPLRPLRVDYPAGHGCAGL